MVENFISALSTSEKHVFVKALLYMIVIDGRVDATEKEFIRQVFQRYQLPTDNSLLKQLPTLPNLLAELKSTVTNPTNARLLIFELLSLAHADDELAEQELKLVEKIAETFRIPDDRVIELDRMVLGYKQFCLRLNTLIEE